MRSKKNITVRHTEKRPYDCLALFRLFLLFIAILFGIRTNAQHFTDALNTLNTAYRQEKLYVQSDRQVYTEGETIWFKSYLFAGNFPSQISKTIYTELTDAKGTIIGRVILPVIRSAAAGAIEIPKGSSGTLFLRSYTKWMLNFDSAFLYSKAIQVIPVIKDEKTSTFSAVAASGNTAIPASQLALQFFPEGGDLVTGLQSVVAFKATDKNGMPVAVSGDIVNTKGNKITGFTSMHDGMGTFMLQPESGETYHAVCINAQGETQTIPLPMAGQSGVVLQVNDLKDQLAFKIEKSAGNTLLPFVWLVAQMNEQQVYRAKIKFSETADASGLIPVAKLPAGIVQLTVFSPAEEPLAERIAFVNLADHSFTTNMQVTVADTGLRKKNTIEIEVPDTLSTDLSIAVTDAAIDVKQQEENIFSSLLLTSDIKGYVHNPAYYFSSDADSVAAHLDLVMLTNGWRRFRWKELLAGHLPVIKYLPENFISVDGQVKGLNKKELTGKEMNFILAPKNKNKSFFTIPIQAGGAFTISGMIFYDTAKLFYQFNKDKKKSLTGYADIKLQNNLLQAPPQLLPQNFLPQLQQQQDSVALQPYIQAFARGAFATDERSKTLKTVIVKTKIRTPKELADERYSSGYFKDDPSRQSRIILPEDDPAFLASQNLFTYLRDRVAGLQVYVDGTDAHITWRGFETALFVDEIPQTSLTFEPPGKIYEDPSYMLSLSMSEIAMVKIYDPPFFGSGSASSGGQGGAIAVYLKKAGDASAVKGLGYSDIAGYTAFKEFYSPDNSMSPQSNKADHPITLYWNPYIFLNKTNRHIVLTYYNNGSTKKMRMIIEGCNENGKLTRIEKIVQ